MAINQVESSSFHANTMEMDTAPDQFIEAFFTPENSKGSYQEFLNCNGYNASGELRNTTDDLSIKFLEGANTAFPPYQNCNQAQAQAYPSMYTKKCMSMPADNSNSKPNENTNRNITRSFSLIMAAFEHDSIGAGPNPMLGAQYQEKKYPEMQPQSSPESMQQMYPNYNEGINSNQSSGHNFMPLAEPDQAQNGMQKIPQQRVDELLCTLRNKGPAPLLKKQKSSSENMSSQTDVSKGYRRASPFDDAQSYQPASHSNHAAAAAAAENSNAYERNISIGTKLFRALQRTRTENVESAAARRAARQQTRLKKTPKQAGGAANKASTNSSPVQQPQSSQPHVEMEVLVQRTRVITQENESLKCKLEMMSRLSSAQAAKLEEMNK
jgi:hypothetical protein